MKLFSAASESDVRAGTTASISLHAQLLGRVEAAFASLPERYLGRESGFDATFQIRLGDVGRTWQVRATADRCEVRRR